jgi:hypothetical protein
MSKAQFTLLAVAGLLMTVANSKAGLGWSFDECVQHYGQTTEPNTRTKEGKITCQFSAQGYNITAFFITNTVSRILYIRDLGFDTERVEKFLASNAPDAIWTDPVKDNSDGSYRWTGNKNGAYAYYAGLIYNGHVLVIWTKEDNDFAEARAAQEASGL